MKIMMVITGMKSGGAERVMATLCNELSKRHQVRLLVIKGDHSDYSLSECADIVFGRLTNNNILASTLLVKKQYEEWMPEIVLAFMNKTAIVALLARMISAYKPKIIGAERANPYNSDKVVRTLRKLLYPSADGFVFQTKQAQDYYKNILRCESIVLRNPLNPDFKVIPYNGERKKKIVTMGRLSKEKNQALLIRTFAQIADKYPEYTVEIYGAGPLHDELEQLIHLVGMESRVFLMGRKNEVQQYIQDASVFVLPSNSEGMPNALLEAMALGLPSIATDCPIGGSAVIIQNNKNGILIPMNDEKELAEALERTIDDNTFAEALSHAAHDVTIDFETGKVCAEWENYLKKVESGK
jgi:glycosyltransferase involved in cell wall biosynthesis